MWVRWVVGLLMALPVLGAGLLAWQGVVSRRAESRPVLGVVDGRVQPCDSAEHCVQSRDDDDDSHVAPLSFEGDPAEAFERLRRVVAAEGGEIDSATDAAEGYLRASFTSSLFGFVDDVEFLVDPAAGVIHVRSASRVGRSDLGANRARIERLRANWAS